MCPRHPTPDSACESIRVFVYLHLPATFPILLPRWCRRGSAGEVPLREGGDEGDFDEQADDRFSGGYDGDGISERQTCGK